MGLLMFLAGLVGPFAALAYAVREIRRAQADAVAARAGARRSGRPARGCSRSSGTVACPRSGWRCW